MLVEEDLALVVRAKAGEKAAVEILWDAITPKLYGYLVHVLRDSHIAEDILQETWIKAIRKIDQFQPRKVRFSAWLFAIAKNECRQHWRKNKNVNFVDETEIPEVFVAEESGDEDKMFLEGVLKGLEEDEREILRLRYIADLSFKEIARVLSISVIAARVRVHRALGKARGQMETTTATAGSRPYGGRN